MSCPSQDDLVGYALGALEPREDRGVAKHAGRCERCATELRRLAPAVGVLAESVEQLEPPDSLRRNLMAAVHGDASEGAVDMPKVHEPRRDRMLGFIWRPAAVVGASALFAAGAIGYALRDDEGSTETVAVTGAADAGGKLVIDEDGATLQAHGMKVLHRGAVYQVWVAEDGEVTPSAAFVPHPDGTATAAVPEAAEGAERVLVTVEPQPGRTAPSGPEVLEARL